MAMGGSTNVALHSVEIARAAGLDLWDDVMSQEEFNELSHRVPVLVNMRPFGLYSMVDIEAKGGVAGDREGTARRRLARRQLPHVHRRDARRAGAIA